MVWGRVGQCEGGTVTARFCFALRFFCVALVHWALWAIKFLAGTAGRQVIRLKKRKRLGVVWGSLGWGDGASAGYRHHVFFCVAVFLRCSFCLRCSHCCVTVFLRMVIVGSWTKSDDNLDQGELKYCFAVFFALLFF